MWDDNYTRPGSSSWRGQESWGRPDSVGDREHWSPYPRSGPSPQEAWGRGGSEDWRRSRTQTPDEMHAGYYNQYDSEYGPMHSRLHQRQHERDLTVPPAYGLRRPPLMHDGVQPPPWMSHPERAPFSDPSSWNEPLAMEITYNVSSVEADVQWKVPPALHHGAVGYEFDVVIEGGENKQDLKLPQWRSTLRMKVNSGTWYSVIVKAIANGKIVAVANVKFKAVFNISEMKDLYLKAIKYCGLDMHRFDIFYRNKPVDYWDKIRYNRDGIMEAYLKDANGQPGSPINGAFDGLFFSANLQSGGRLPIVSPFGPVRLMIPADRLLHMGTNLYFADFYCNYSAHYVTIVCCIPGSPTDEYCRRTLIPLPLNSNPFLRLFNRGGAMEHWVNDNIWIETFYTENVPLHLGQFDRVQSTGKSTPGGLPNNKYCTLCNLYPLPPPPGVDPTQLTTSTRKRKLDSQSLDSTKKPREGEIEGENEGEEEEYEEDLNPAEFSDYYNSTFHLCMELERERLGTNADEYAAVHVIEILSALSDKVVAEIGSVIPVPETPLPPRFTAIKEPTPVIVKQALSPGKEEVVDECENVKKMTPEGKDVYELLVTSSTNMTERCDEVEKTLKGLQSQLIKLETKLKPLIAA